MANNFLERLNKDVLVCQGANATNLISKGLDISRSPASWLIDHPKEVEEHVREFVDAGSDIILCSSASANRFHLKKYGFQDKVADFNLEVARLWREITPKDRLLAATLYSTGQFLEPVGEATFEEIYESYHEQMTHLVEVEFDAVWVMTMGDIREAQAAIQAIRDCTDLPVIASMAFSSGKKGFHTMMGNDPRSAAMNLQKFGADVVGANCGDISLQEIADVIREMKTVSECFLVAKPNAGIPKTVDGKTAYEVSQAEIADASLDWIAAGARIVGGCCGTTPDHTACIANAVKKERMKR